MQRVILLNVRTSIQENEELLKKPFSRSIEEPAMWERRKPKLKIVLYQILEFTAIFCEIQPHLHMCLPLSLMTDYAFSQTWAPLLIVWMATAQASSSLQTTCHVGIVPAFSRMCCLLVRSVHSIPPTQPRGSQTRAAFCAASSEHGEEETGICWYQSASSVGFSTWYRESGINAHIL